MSWRTRWSAWQARLGSLWSSLRTRTTSRWRTEQTTTGSSDSSRSAQIQTTLFSPAMASTYATVDGLRTITVNVGLREEWKDWEISSAVTHSRSLSLTLTRTPSPRS